MVEVEIKEVPASEVLSLSFTGPYEQTQDRLDDLLSWVLRAGHPYSGCPQGLFFDDPANVAADDLRGEVCVVIEEQCEGFEGVVRKDMPAATLACATFTGPYEQLRPHYQEVFDWIAANGYRYLEDQPVREVYHVLYGQADDPQEFVTELQVPVEPADKPVEPTEQPVEPADRPVE